MYVHLGSLRCCGATGCQIHSLTVSLHVSWAQVFGQLLLPFLSGHCRLHHKNRHTLFLLFLANPIGLRSNRSPVELSLTNPLSPTSQTPLSHRHPYCTPWSCHLPPQRGSFPFVRVLGSEVLGGRDRVFLTSVPHCPTWDWYNACCCFAIFNCFSWINHRYSWEDQINPF